MREGIFGKSIRVQGEIVPPPRNLAKIIDRNLVAPLISVLATFLLTCQPWTDPFVFRPAVPLSVNMYMHENTGDKFEFKKLCLNRMPMIGNLLDNIGIFRRSVSKFRSSLLNQHSIDGPIFIRFSKFSFCSSCKIIFSSKNLCPNTS